MTVDPMNASTLLISGVGAENGPEKKTRAEAEAGVVRDGKKQVELEKGVEAETGKGTEAGTKAGVGAGREIRAEEEIGTAVRVEKGGKQAGNVVGAEAEGDPEIGTRAEAEAETGKGAGEGAGTAVRVLVVEKGGSCEMAAGNEAEAEAESKLCAEEMRRAAPEKRLRACCMAPTKNHSRHAA